jgi:hypothetical protein
MSLFFKKSNMPTEKCIKHERTVPQIITKPEAI